MKNHTIVQANEPKEEVNVCRPKTSSTSSKLRARHPLGKYFFILPACILFLIPGLFFPGEKPVKQTDGKAVNNGSAPTAQKELEVQVPPPPFSEDIFPCSQCHNPEDMEINRERRQLDAHEDIILKHDEANRWCLDCHDAENRDQLHLADGRPVSFKESYKLCGQCHGPKLKDWRNGIHGRRTGEWNGKKKYLLCAHCHNPHSPRFKSLKPEPPPHKWKANRKNNEKAEK